MAKNKNMPPEFLLPFMQSIESTVVVFREEFPKLIDKDVEFVYDKLTTYYAAKAAGKNVDEPEVTSQIKQDFSFKTQVF